MLFFINNYQTIILNIFIQRPGLIWIDMDRTDFVKKKNTIKLSLHN